VTSAGLNPEREDRIDPGDPRYLRGGDPLGGLRVLDLSTLLPGAVCSMVLADLGADVIKVEQPGGDPMRRFRPDAFGAVNRNKRSIGLDLKNAAARAILRKLTSSCDVVLESFRPGVARRLDADYERLSAINPQLIYCSLSGYGQTGPYRDWPGHDLNFLSVAGIASLSGDPEGPPRAEFGVVVADFAGSLYGAISILSAVIYRKVHGLGQYIDLSLTESALSLAGYRATESAARNHPGKAAMMSKGAFGIYCCADGLYLALEVVEEHFWERLCASIGRDDLARDPRYANHPMRKINSRALQEELARVFATRTRADWLARLHRDDVPVSHVNELEDLLSDAHFAHRGAFMHVAGPSGAPSLPQVRFPARFGIGTDQPTSRWPAYGEHTAEVLREFAYTEEDLELLVENGAVTVADQV
jgi:CoA:oxalate CoA-transferase